MSLKPFKTCNKVSCGKLTRNLYCEEHSHLERLSKQMSNRNYDNSRPSWHKWYTTNRWLNMRLFQLQKEPLCNTCKLDNKLTPATVVDHIVPHKGDPFLFWNPNNLQSLCEICHNIKTGKGL